MFFIAKLMGHRQISQLDAFDYITGITLGSIAAELATELENPMRPVIAMAVYGLLTLLMNQITLRRNRSRKFIEGTPTILFHNDNLVTGEELPPADRQTTFTNMMKIALETAVKRPTSSFPSASAIAYPGAELVANKPVAKVPQIPFIK